MAFEEAAVIVRSSLVYGFHPMDPKTSLLLSGLKTVSSLTPIFETE